MGHRGITINKKTIKLQPSKNKKFPGWWTFPYKKVTYYITFTTRGVKVVTLKGTKVVTGKTTTKPKTKKNKKHPKGNKKHPKGTKKHPKGTKKHPKGTKKHPKGNKKHPKKKPVSLKFVFGHLTGTWGLRFPR